MIWRDEDRRDDLQKKQEYARELEQQIELRKALEREEKLQQEMWEKHFVEPKDEQSPAKWWTDLGGASAEGKSRFSFHMDSTALPYANPLIENGEHGASSTASATTHQRFRNAVDPLSTQDRLREKAQQLEWRRLLDEQVRDKERRLLQEAEEKRLREHDEVHEEMRLLRDRQLRAQRKLGLPLSAAYSPQHYRSIPSPPAPPKSSQASSQYQAYDRLTRQDQEETTMPPPAPVYAGRQQQTTLNDSVDFNFRQAMGLVDPPAVYESQQRDHIADEYRALLVEIRRERDELRRERDELRREKEELRMERVLMQMENEKMATLLESQRQMNEQRLETMDRIDRALETRASTAVTPQRGHPIQPQARTPKPTRLPSPLHVSRRDHSVSQRQRPLVSPPLPATRARASPTSNRTSRPGAMSLADFAPASNLHSPPKALDSSRFRRLSRYRFIDDENPLEQSLNGESEFIAVSPRQDRTAPRITETASPTASRLDPMNGARYRENTLRSSRVIKSRGFYDINRDDALPVQRERARLEQQRAAQAQLSPSRHARRVSRPKPSSPLSAYDPRRYDRRSPESSDNEADNESDEHEEEEREEEEEEEERGEDSEGDQEEEPPLSLSRFQVQVLVHD